MTPEEKAAALQRIQALESSIQRKRLTKNTQIRNPEKWNADAQPIDQSTAADPYQGARDPAGPISARHTKAVVGSALVGAGKIPRNLGRMVGMDTSRVDKEMAPYSEGGEFYDPGASAAGNVAASYLLGGMVAKPLQAASRVLRAAGAARGGAGVAGRAANAAGRVVGNPTAQAISEGAAQGAVINDDPAEGAISGALIGGALRVPFAVAEGASKGLVKSRKGYEAAKRLVERRSGQTVDAPLAQRIDESTGPLAKAIGFTYRSILPYFPGAGGMLRKQHNAAEEAWRLSNQQKIADAGRMGNLPRNAAAAAEIERSTARIRGSGLGKSKGLTKTFEDTIHQYRFAPNSPSVQGVHRSLIDTVDDRLTTGVITKDVPGYHADVKKFVQYQVDKHVDSAGELSGRATTEVRTKIWDKASEFKGSEAQAYREAANAVDDYVVAETIPTAMRQHMDDLANGRPSTYRPTAAEYDNWVAMEQWKGARKGWGKMSSIREAQLAATAAGKQGAYSVKGLEKTHGGDIMSNPAKTEIRVGRKLLPQDLTDPDPWARRMALNVGGVGASALVLGAPVTGSILGGGALLASKTAQKALFGDLSTQKRLAEAIRKYGKESDEVQRMLRTTEIVKGNQ